MFWVVSTVFISRNRGIETTALITLGYVGTEHILLVESV